MQARTDWGLRERERACAYGRRLRDDLLSQFQNEYGIENRPPPAKVVDELLRDFLDVTLRYEALGTDRYAEIRHQDGRVVVTVNSQTAQIERVKDAVGVQNVTKWHEAVHVVRDLDVLKVGPQASLPGLDVVPRVVCFRSPGLASSAERSREVWAEEAGRAAAVSLPALSQSAAFRCLVRGVTSNREAWRMLYQSADDIGVNISALVKQLQFDRLIVVVGDGGSQRVHVQPALAEQLGGT